MSSNNSLQAPLQFPDPPSTNPKASNCTATLEWLKTNLATIYTAGRNAASSRTNSPNLTRSAYLGMYSTAHTFCMDAKKTPKHRLKDALDGEDLYRGVQDEIMTHCSEVRNLLPALGDGDEVDDARRLIEKYMDHRQMLTSLAAQISHLLQPLERDWVSRSISESRKGVLLIEDLHTRMWKDEVLPVGVDSVEATLESMLKTAMKALEAQGEERSERDTDLVKECKKSLASSRVAPGKDH